MLTKYFSFSRTIPWKCYHNPSPSEYVITSHVERGPLSAVINNKDTYMVVFGGLLESFFSLILLEVTNKICPQNDLYWIGKSTFSDLVKLNALAKISNINFNKELLINYPTPLFVDKKDHVYYNFITNYIKNPFTLKKIPFPIIQQLLNNCIIDKPLEYLPELRLTDFLDSYHTACLLAKINENKPFLLIFDDMKLSMHNKKTLNWSVQQVFSFASMLNSIGVDCVMLTDKVTRYHNSAVKALPFRFDYAWHLLTKARYLMSYCIDPLLIGILLSSKCRIISNVLDKEFNILNNFNYLHNGEKILAKERVEPLEAFEFIRSLNG